MRLIVLGAENGKKLTHKQEFREVIFSNVPRGNCQNYISNIET